jgi:hypothetical protein
MNDSLYQLLDLFIEQIAPDHESRCGCLVRGQDEYGDCNCVRGKMLTLLQHAAEEMA